MNDASAYQGYARSPPPAEEAELVRVERGTPAGEYLRRAWQPVALAAEIGDRPFALTVLGEDLVLFRAGEGRWGLVHRHCPHRGASLEYGIVEPRGLRCCYHGWLVAPDGRVLETPAEPERSRLGASVVHGAYPAVEHRGLVFAYLGPPGTAPALPLIDTVEAPGNLLVPFAFETPCNWILIGDNGMDPAHASFLHMIGFPQFGAGWSELPEIDFRETPIGMIYVTAARLGAQVWVRSNDAILPNIAQSAANWVDGQHPHRFSRASMTRWKVPIDRDRTLQIGWRHFNAEVDPAGLGDAASVGREKLDIVGQTRDARSYAERQRVPSDYDVLASQRVGDIGGRERLGAADRGVVMLRALIRRGIRALNGAAPDGPAPAGVIATYAHDTILTPPAGAGADRAALRRLAREVTALVLASAGRGWDERRAHVRAELARLESRPVDA
jgi:nitrite reductase/ring-hydroxylating ferredoxin subunit